MVEYQQFDEAWPNIFKTKYIISSSNSHWISIGFIFQGREVDREINEIKLSI